MKGTLKQSVLTRKGQAATEFLMTYGWAILAIVIVAAVLWNMGVFKGQCAKTAAVQVFGSGEQLQASDWALDTTNTLTISLKNLAGSDITISNTRLDVGNSVGVTNNTAITVPAGSSGTNVVQNTVAPGGTTGNCFSANIAMNYSVTGGVAHPITGTLKGKY